MTGRGRGWALGAVVTLGVLLVLEGASWVAVARLRAKGEVFDPMPTRLLEPQRGHLRQIVEGRGAYLQADATLGWRLKAGLQTGMYRSNAAGLRSLREYSPEAAPGVLRVAAFGDSYTQCSEVENAQAWPSLLEQADARLDVLNYGIAGYGIDQAFLRYRDEGRTFRPRVVLIGFMSDDLGRSVSTFRPFMWRGTGTPLAKPRFVLEGGALRLIENPMRRREDYASLLADEPGRLAQLGENDFFWRTGYRAGPFDWLRMVQAAKLARHRLRQVSGENLLDSRGQFNTASEAFRISVAVIEGFVREVKTNGAEPLVLLFPGPSDVELAAGRHGCPYAPLRQALVERGLPLFDLLTPLVEARRAHAPKELFARFHYTPLGNRIVADALWPRLDGFRN